MIQQHFDPTINDYPIRTDPPSTIIIHDRGRALIKGENFVICKRNGSQEIVIQSELSANRAQYSVDVLNEHEQNNARRPVYYWRIRTSKDQPS